ncbi:SLBB domain-containing protein [Anaeroselena agilis]|uniref:SLBB domain-containing protein n=1 Tax=Anaeroselena agilis TaxID=3063788 RepID=A0ABU3P205_9FIRM|nr:SLBB domain-containing protein [Selenomonadales bacterium 4137-cl]
MYEPVRGPSRVARLKKRKDGGKLRFCGKAVFSLTVALVLTLMIPAVPDLHNPFAPGIFSASGHQQPPPSPPKTEYAIVYISGAVTNPGVVKVPVGTTTGDIVKLAGGLAAGADNGKLELMKPVQDGMHIHINKTTTPAKAALTQAKKR